MFKMNIATQIFTEERFEDVRSVDLTLTQSDINKIKSKEKITFILDGTVAVNTKDQNDLYNILRCVVETNETEDETTYLIKLIIITHFGVIEVDDIELIDSDFENT
jgi:hypothetical protein